jgi:hypothetical protein
MDKNLRLEIESDILGFPKTKQGSIITLCLIMKRMVVKNQEAQDALETYIKDSENKPFRFYGHIKLGMIESAIFLQGMTQAPSSTLRSP